MRNINLLPPEIAQKRRVRRQAFLLVLLGIVYLVLLISVWLVRNLEVGRQDDRLREAQAQSATLQTQVNALQEFANLEKTVKDRQAVLATVMQGDVAWSRLLIELSMIIPGDSWLTSFIGTAGQQAAQQQQPQQPPGATAALGTLNFGSNTFDFPGVAKWISRLQELKSLQNIWVPTATKSAIAGRDVITFTSTADLSGEAASNRFQGAGK
jgi:Tfp pilus assembly protein PilN